MIREMFLYPWDAYDEGLPSVTHRLREMKIAQVSLAVLYHHARILLPHDPVRKLLLHQSGSLYIPFDEKRYGSLKPNRGTAVPDGFVPELISCLKENGIKVSAWSVLLHNSDLAQRFPVYALQNIYGDRSPSNLCPSNREVRDYVLRVCADIASSGFSGIDAESLDYAGFLHGDHHEMFAYADAGSLNKWLGLCFCPACIQNAEARGVDVRKLMDQVRKSSDAFLRMEEVPGVDPELLNAYVSFRCDSITDLFRDIATQTGLPVRPIVWAAGGADPIDSGVDPRKILPADMVLCYPSSPEETEAFLKINRKKTSPETGITGGIRLMSPQTTESSQVLRYEEAYRTNNVNRVIYYQYGMAPLPFLNELTEKR